MNKPRIVVILGLSRSGTALLCQILEAMGVYWGEPGDLVGPSEINERGHYEHRAIARIQQQLLKNEFGVSWLHSGDIDKEHPNWLERESVQFVYKQALLRTLAKFQLQAGPINTLFGFKDARTLCLMPLWREIFEELVLEPVYLFTWRHPREVYASTTPWPEIVTKPEQGERHFERVSIPGLPRDPVDEMWAKYGMAARRLKRELRAEFEYAQWFNEHDAMIQVRDLAEATGLEPLTEEELHKIVQPDLWHCRAAR
jgi:hypothetical protein